MDDNKQMTLDDAMTQAQDMFQNQGPAEQQEQPAQEPSQEQGTDPQQELQQEPQTEQNSAEGLTGDAVNTAVAATQAVADRTGELQQVMQEVSSLKEQNQSLQDMISQMSQQQEQSVSEVMDQPQIPVLDFSSMAFDDENTIKQKQADYAKQMADYFRSSIMSEIAPFVEQAKEGQAQKQKSELLETLKDVPQLQGISEMAPQIDNIIANSKALSSSDIPMDDKIMTAYFIARGVDAVNNPKTEPLPPTVEELMNHYTQNKDFRDMVERKRVEELQKGQQVPPMSASSGAFNAALNIQEKPKTIEEASEQARHLFGI